MKTLCLFFLIGCDAAPLAQSCQPPAEGMILTSYPCVEQGQALCEWQGNGNLHQAVDCTVGEVFCVLDCVQ